MNKGDAPPPRRNKKQQRWRESTNVSVVSSLYGVCIEINKIKNTVKDVYTPTDNTDTARFIGENLCPIGLFCFSKREEKKKW